MVVADCELQRRLKTAQSGPAIPTIPVTSARMGPALVSGAVILVPTMVEKTSTAVSRRMAGQSFCGETPLVAGAGALIDNGRVRKLLRPIGGLRHVHDSKI